MKTIFSAVGKQESPSHQKKGIRNASASYAPLAGVPLTYVLVSLRTFFSRLHHTVCALCSLPQHKLSGRVPLEAGMKLTVAVVAALSAGKALAFVPTSSFGSTSTTKASTSANKCNLRMNGAGEEGATGMGSVVAEQQPMGRKQMLQSVAATGLGAILFGAQQASPSFAAADVDFSKVRARDFAQGWPGLVACSMVVPSNAVQSANQPPPMRKGTLTPESAKFCCMFFSKVACSCGSPSRSASWAAAAKAKGNHVWGISPRQNNLILVGCTHRPTILGTDCRQYNSEDQPCSRFEVGRAQ